MQNVDIADRNIWSCVLRHLVLCFSVDVRLLDLHAGAVFGELLMSSV
jgi:hypothetical protein